MFATTAAAVVADADDVAVAAAAAGDVAVTPAAASCAVSLEQCSAECFDLAVVLVVELAASASFVVSTGLVSALD